MSSSKTNILITGATGYIGGSVLVHFLERPDLDSLNITALVRSPEKAEKLKKFGVSTVLGSYDDSALLEELAAASDVVLSIANADHLEALKAILRGLEKRKKATGNTPILIHNSGTGVLADAAAGAYTSDDIYDDSDPDRIETLADTQFHRNVDLEIVNADKQGYVKTYIILPPTIYGIASNKLVVDGIQNPYSIQIPLLIDIALDRGQGGMVGAGKNIWGNVHVEDVADLYLALYDSIKTNSATGHGRDGFYFADGGEHTLYDVAKVISQALVDIGRATSAEPTTFTQEELNKYFQGSVFFGTNTRCRGTHSRAIGWRPKHTAEDMFASVKAEVDAAFVRKPIMVAMDLVADK